MITISIRQGDIVEVELENLAYGGDCVGHVEGLALFVDGGIPGERVKIRINDYRKNFARGEIVEIMEKSTDRKTPVCSVFADCGGCQLQHMDYQTQLYHKRKVVIDALERIGGIKEVDVNQVIAADYPWYYRNKAQFPLVEDEDGQINTGFYRQGSHEVIINDTCHIQHQLINRIVRETITVLNDYDFSAYREDEHQGLLRHLVIRAGVCTNQALLTIVTSSEEFPSSINIAKTLMRKIPELVGVLHNINPQQTNVIMGQQTNLIRGRDQYTEYIGFLKFVISPASFFQVNTLQTEKLYQQIAKYADLKGHEEIIDGYCGIGSIALYLAAKAEQVYGIEVVPEAVKDARYNADINQISNCQFKTGKLEDELPQLIKKGIEPDLMIFDPPRKGLSPEVKATILEYKPDRVIYVSCNPTTLARDLKQLTESYIIKEVQPVDMFPQTYHIESVVLLETTAKEEKI